MQLCTFVDMQEMCFSYDFSVIITVQGNVMQRKRLVLETCLSSPIGQSKPQPWRAHKKRCHPDEKIAARQLYKTSDLYAAGRVAVSAFHLFCCPCLPVTSEQAAGR